MSYRIVLEKEDFKFSCSHFTIFGPAIAERLHGHNYYVVVELGVKRLNSTLGLAFDFNLVKPIVREITREFDERVLLPLASPYLTVEHEGTSVRVKFSGKTYEFPESDVHLLPLVNITSEELARFLAEKVMERASAHAELRARLTSFSLGVQETRGQTVFYDIDLANG